MSRVVRYARLSMRIKYILLSMWPKQQEFCRAHTPCALQTYMYYISCRWVLVVHVGTHLLILGSLPVYSRDHIINVCLIGPLVALCITATQLSIIVTLLANRSLYD